MCLNNEFFKSNRYKLSVNKELGAHSNPFYFGE